MKTMVGYIRVSGEGQCNDGFGLQIQRSSIEKYIKDNNLDLLHIFSENGVSGTLENRPALGELLEYTKTNKIEGVIFVRLDRLARDLLVQENLLAEFQRLGVKPISIDEPDLLSSDPSRVMFRQMKGAIAQYEKSMIALRLSSGRRKKVELGNGYAGGNLPFGFRFENNKYIPVKEELEIVKEIFRLRRKPRYGVRLSFEKLAVILNSKFGHIRTLSASGVFYIANNPFYSGKQQYGGVIFKHLDIASHLVK